MLASCRSASNFAALAAVQEEWGRGPGLQLLEACCHQGMMTTCSHQTRNGTLPTMLLCIFHFNELSHDPWDRAATGPAGGGPAPLRGPLRQGTHPPSSLPALGRAPGRGPELGEEGTGTGWGGASCSFAAMSLQLVEVPPLRKLRVPLGQRQHPAQSTGACRPGRVSGGHRESGHAEGGALHLDSAPACSAQCVPLVPSPPSLSLALLPSARD